MPPTIEKDLTKHEILFYGKDNNSGYYELTFKPDVMPSENLLTLITIMTRKVGLCVLDKFLLEDYVNIVSYSEGEVSIVIRNRREPFEGYYNHCLFLLLGIYDVLMSAYDACERLPSWHNFMNMKLSNNLIHSDFVKIHRKHPLKHLHTFYTEVSKNLLKYADRILPFLNNLYYTPSDIKIHTNIKGKPLKFDITFHGEYRGDFPYTRNEEHELAFAYLESKYTILYYLSISNKTIIKEMLRKKGD